MSVVGFRYAIMLMMAMALHYGIEADKHVMTRVVIVLFEVRKYVFSRFILFHLPFARQEQTLDARDIVARYSQLIT